MTSTTVKRSGVVPGKRAPTSRQRHIKAERLDPEERAAGGEGRTRQSPVGGTRRLPAREVTRSGGATAWSG